jgi:hypothetical protein
MHQAIVNSWTSYIPKCTNPPKDHQGPLSLDATKRFQGAAAMPELRFDHDPTLREYGKAMDLRRASLRIWSDGSWRIETLDTAHSLLVERIGYHSIRLVEADFGRCREIIVTPHRRAGAWVVTTVQRVGERITRLIETTYSNGTKRTDHEEPRQRSIVRHSTWRFFNGESATAEYGAGSRVVTYSNQNEVVTRRVKSIYTPTRTGFRVRTSGQIISQRSEATAETQISDSDVIIVGATAIIPGSSGTAIQPGAGLGGGSIVSTVTQDTNGKITVTSATAGNGASLAGGYVMSTSTGDTSSSVIIQTADGTIVYSNAVVQGTGPNGGPTFSQGYAGTTAGGGFIRYSETTEDRSGNTTQSSLAADGQGNISETTVVTHSDGGFTITTITSNGITTTTDSQSYDSSGNLITNGSSSGGGSGDPSSGGGSGDPSSGGGSGDPSSGGGSGDPSSGGGGSGDSGSGGGSGNEGSSVSDGSMPSDDGTDETPKGRVRGAGDVAFDQLFGSDSTPSLTGGLGTEGQLTSAPFVPIHDIGDPAVTIQQSMKPDPEVIGSTGSGPLPGASPAVINVVLKVPMSTDDWGDLNNPRALVGAAAQFVGIHGVALSAELLAAYQRG